MGLWYKNGSTNLGQKIRPYSNQQKKKRTWKIEDFATPADQRIKLKKVKRRMSGLTLLGNWKKNMKVKVIPILIGAFGSH